MKKIYFILFRFISFYHILFLPIILLDRGCFLLVPFYLKINASNDSLNIDLNSKSDFDRHNMLRTVITLIYKELSHDYCIIPFFILSWRDMHKYPYIRIIEFVSACWSNKGFICMSILHVNVNFTCSCFKVGLPRLSLIYLPHENSWGWHFNCYINTKLN